jgi:hypothetical protein
MGLQILLSRPKFVWRWSRLVYLYVGYEVLLSRMYAHDCLQVSRFPPKRSPRKRLMQQLDGLE